MTTNAQSTALVKGGFQDWDEEDQEEFDKANAAAKAGEILKLLDNADNMVRILPPVRIPDPTLPGGFWQMTAPHLEFYQHFYDYPGDPNKKVVFTCPKWTPGVKKPCPQCEDLDAMLAERGKPAFGSPDATFHYNRKAKRVIVVNAIDCLLPNAGARRFYYNPRQSAKKGPGVHELLEELRVKDGVKYWHPVNGCNVCIRKDKGTGDFDVTYSLIRKKFQYMPIEDVGDGFRTAEEWATMAHDLRMDLIAPSYPECRLIMQGKDPRRQDDGAGPVGGARRGGRNAQSMLEDDE